MRKLYLTLAASALGVSSAFALPIHKEEAPLRVKSNNCSSRLAKGILAIDVSRLRVAGPKKAVDTNEWELVGICKWRDDILTSFDAAVATWEVQVYEQKGNAGTYLVENPYGNGNCPFFDYDTFDGSDFIFNASDPDMVYTYYTEIKGLGIQYQDGTGVHTTPCYLCDEPSYYINYFATMGMELTIEDLMGYGIQFASGKMKGGRITYPKNGLLIDLPELGEDYTYYANINGQFAIAFPGSSDYDFSLECPQSCHGDTFAALYTVGKDVTEVKYTMQKGWKGEESSTAEAALIEEAASKGFTATDGKIECPLSYGVNTFTIVLLNSDGEVVDSQIMHIYGQHADEGNWTSLGVTDYREAFLADTYENMTVDAYPVEIQKNNETEGVYRLVDTYGENWGMYYDILDQIPDAFIGCDHTHYVTVDASNPDRVMIEAFPMGLDFGDGECQGMSAGWYMIQQGTDPENEQVLVEHGTLKDGVITMPGGSLLTLEPGYGITRGNINHTFRIDLNKISGIDNVVAGDSDTLIYTLDGRKVKSTQSQGVYIIRQGDKSHKVIR